MRSLERMLYRLDLVFIYSVPSIWGRVIEASSQRWAATSKLCSFFKNSKRSSTSSLDWDKAYFIVLVLQTQWRRGESRFEKLLEHSAFVTLAMSAMKRHQHYIQRRACIHVMCHSSYCVLMYTWDMPHQNNLKRYPPVSVWATGHPCACLRW